MKIPKDQTYPCLVKARIGMELFKFILRKGLGAGTFKLIIGDSWNQPNEPDHKVYFDLVEYQYSKDAYCIRDFEYHERFITNMMVHIIKVYDIPEFPKCLWGSSNIKKLQGSISKIEEWRLSNFNTLQGDIASLVNGLSRDRYRKNFNIISKYSDFVNKHFSYNADWYNQTISL